MKTNEFWAMVTHQANRPPNRAAIARAVEAARTEVMCDTALGHAMMAACAYYGWEYGTTDYEKAVAHATAAADLGDAWGLFYLGVCCHEGRGVPVNYERAATCLRASVVRGGVPLALHDLGLCYLEGHGVMKDGAKAYRLFEQAAQHQLALGIHMLGYCYETGTGCKQDLDKAEHQHEQALEMGLELSRPRLQAIRDYKAGRV